MSDLLACLDDVAGGGTKMAAANMGDVAAQAAKASAKAADAVIDAAAVTLPLAPDGATGQEVT